VTLVLPERGLAPYVTAGDGGLDTTLAVLHGLERAGATCVELGLPFSDPIADGPVLQAAAQRALAAGTTFDGVLEVIRSFRKESGLPIVVMSYANPLLRRGWQASARAIEQAGGTGLLVADLPVEESGPMRAAAIEADLWPIFFVAPTTSQERMTRAIESSRGFVYAIGRFGVTGGRTALDPAAQEFLARVRARAEVVRVAVGFGIATRADVAAVLRHANLAIVGSALVERVHDAFEASGRKPEAAGRAAHEFASELMEGVRS